MTQEKSFWHKTKEVTGSIWDGTKEVTEDVWEGTKNMAGGIKNAFTRDDDEDLHEEAIYAASADHDDINEDLEMDEEVVEKTEHHASKH